MRKFLFSLVLSTLLLAGNGWSATYYVDQTGGNDANNGLSTGSAWKTIAKVNALDFAPGDSILFKRGETWREHLAVPSSGSAGNPITIGAYGAGIKPIIQPTAQVSSWTQVGTTNVYYGTLASTPANVFINNAYCQPAHWPTAVGANPPTFKFPSGNSADSTHLTDSSLQGTAEANLVGAQVNIYINASQQTRGAISAWNNGANILTIGNVSANPTTSMRYYLTAPSGAGISYSSKSWMMSENTWFYDKDAQRLYVWKTGGGNPGTAEASIAWYAISASNKSYITIDGIIARYAIGDGIYIYANVSNVSGITIANSEANYNSTNGINVYAESGRAVSATITNNLIDHNAYSGIRFTRSVNSSANNNSVTYTNWYPVLPWKAYPILVQAGGVTINNNTVSYSSNNGISCISADSCTITNNHIDHTNTIIEDGGGIYTDDSTGHMISGNILTGGTGYGIYLDENTTNSTVELNSVAGGSFGIMMHASSGNTARKNKLTGPFTIGGGLGAIYIANYSNVGTHNINYNVINCVNNNSSAGIGIWSVANSYSNIYNNDLMNCSTGVRIGNNVANVLNNVSNNIFYNNTTHISTSPGNITSIDYNLYYGAGNWIWGGASKATFSLWKSGSSQDGASIAADPRFISTSDFRLTENSPAIDAGKNVNLTSDYLSNPVPFGSGPDIGAYEYTPLQIPPPPIYTPIKTPVPPTNLKISP